MEFGQWFWAEIDSIARKIAQQAVDDYNPDLTRARGPLPESNLSSITDAQHGDRLGGTLHALADAVSAGFMSAAHWLKLENISFLTLPDTPSAYTGEGGKVLRVKAAVDGVEFHALTASDVGADPAGTTATHAALTNNPHSVTAAQVGALTQAAADLLYSVLGHTHAFSAITGSIDVAQHGNQAINVVLAGPASGSPGAVSWRALVAADIPTLAASKITGTAIVADSAGASQALNGNLSIAKANPQMILNGSAGDTSIRAVWQAAGVSMANFTWNDATANFDVGTGAGSGGSLRLTTVGTVRVTLDTLGNVVFGSGLGTGSTDGFIYISSGAGTPTGVPTTYTSRVPLYYDRTNHILYVYSGGAWRAH